jgi:hypothetical protein
LVRDPNSCDYDGAVQRYLFRGIAKKIILITVMGLGQFRSSYGEEI